METFQLEQNAVIKQACLLLRGLDADEADGSSRLA